MSDENPRLNVHVPEDMRRSLRLLSAKTGRPMSEHIRAAIRRYLDRQIEQDTDEPKETT